MCLGKYDNNDNEQTFGTLLEYPYLLQAIFKEGPVEKRIVLHYPKDDSYYLCHLKDIVLPDNYKEFVQYIPAQIFYKTFGDLPEELKTAIVKRYEQQKQ